jgi:hypothetical protein
LVQEILFSFSRSFLSLLLTDFRSSTTHFSYSTTTKFYRTICLSCLFCHHWWAYSLNKPRFSKNLATHYVIRSFSKYRVIQGLIASKAFSWATESMICPLSVEVNFMYC